MCEVTKNNFKNLFEEIDYNVLKSTFVAIDCEFSGLTSDPDIRNSLFDSPSDRYLKLKESVGQFIIFQFGLSTFVYNRDLNQYDTVSYKFYIFPRSFGIVDARFLCQASSFEFLCRFNFNFNKVIYDGIPYLTLEQEDMLRKKLSEGSLFQHAKQTLDSEETNLIIDICSSVTSWVSTASESDVLTLTPPLNNQVFYYVLHEEIRRKFPTVWSLLEGNVLKLKVVSLNERKRLEEDEQCNHHELVDHYTGFSSIFKLLCKYKKPIVGHNLFLDLLIVYNQFYKPLPDSLKQFKKDILELFPSLYDTKVLGYELQRSLSKENKFEGTSLGNLYEYLTTRGMQLSSYSPRITLKSGLFDNVMNQQIHDAGWDSYMTGYSFIKLSHIMASKVTVGQLRALTSVERFAAVNNFKNKVNLARAAASLIDLQGSDTVTFQRPPILYVAARKKEFMDIQKLSTIFAKYGGVDLKKLNSYSALLAVTNYGCAKDILRDFKKNHDIRVEKYTYLRHSPAIRIFLWAGVLIPTIGLGLYVSIKNNKTAAL